MFKHLIMFSPYIWSIMTVTSMFIDMLFSSTLNTKDFLAPAHDLGGPKIQQSCSSRFNRVVHRYKKHASMLFMFTNTTQTLNLGKRNAGNILQHIHTLFISSTGCIKKNGTQRFQPKIYSSGRILLIQGCFRTRISCLNHMGTLIIPIKCLKCLKNASTTIWKEHYISEYLDSMWILRGAP